MIAYLRGQVINKNLNYVIIEVSQVGYQVFCTENILNDLPIKAEAELYIHQQIREDSNDLYGFKTLADLEFFTLLLTVSGVGPKSALGILAVASAGDLREAIMRGNVDLLTKVSGIGRKTAERLVLELKNKVVKISGDFIGHDSISSIGGDEIDALISLGYSLNEARTALNNVPPDISDRGERVKAALRSIAQKS